MEEITINGTKYNLVPQEEVVVVKEKVSYKRPRAEKGEYYYYIFPGWIDSASDDRDGFNKGCHIAWNYYLTEQQAQKARDKQLATVRVNDAIDELNEGWVADWSDSDEAKYNIDYNFRCKQFGVNSSYIYSQSHTIKCIKSEEITDQIIKEHEEDLKLIFNIA